MSGRVDYLHYELVCPLGEFPCDDESEVHVGQLMCASLAMLKGRDGSLVYGGHRSE